MPLDEFHGKQCPYCGDPMLGDRPPSRDHVVPRWKGGTVLLVVCLVCNQDKGGKTLQQWANRLHKAKDWRTERVQALVKQMGLTSRRERLRKLNEIYRS